MPITQTITNFLNRRENVDNLKKKNIPVIAMAIILKRDVLKTAAIITNPMKNKESLVLP